MDERVFTIITDMKTKFERFNEIYDDVLKKYVERYYKDSYRRGWSINDIVYSCKHGKWIIKWERKP